MADTKEIITCPACGHKMKKVYIENEGFCVDICTEGCGGILFDNNEFKKFDEQRESIDVISNELSEKSFMAVDQRKTRVCPVCDTNMIKNYSSIKEKIQIDQCYACGAIFLDNNELEAIRDEFSTENERIEDFNKEFLNMFGADILEAERKAQIASEERSFAYKKFLKVFNALYNLRRK